MGKTITASMLVMVLFLQSAALADLISVSRRVGLKLDEDERDTYGLFEKENDFAYAVFIQLKDGTRTLNIVYDDGSTKTRILTDAEFNAFRRHIDEFNPDRPPFIMRGDIYKKDGVLYALLATLGSSLMVGYSVITK